MPGAPYRTIPLRARDGTVRAYALVDDADYAWLSQWRWSLHRAILGLEYGDRRFGEHKDRNPLNCQRSNLRIANRGHADNQQNRGLDATNTSGYRGVSWHKQRHRWRAVVVLDGGARHLGLFDTAEQADAAAKAFRAAHMPFSQEAGAA